MRWRQQHWDSLRVALTRHLPLRISDVDGETMRGAIEQHHKGLRKRGCIPSWRQADLSAQPDPGVLLQWGRAVPARMSNWCFSHRAVSSASMAAATAWSRLRVAIRARDSVLSKVVSRKRPAARLSSVLARGRRRRHSLAQSRRRIQPNARIDHRRERLRTGRASRRSSPLTSLTSKNFGSKSSPAHVRIRRYSG